MYTGLRQRGSEGWRLLAEQPQLGRSLARASVLHLVAYLLRMGLFNFVKYLFNDVPLDYQGPETGWYVVPNYSQFTYSTVRGDFRLLPLAEGRFAACWKDLVSVRDVAGRQLWRADGTGLVAAASPDGSQLLAYSDSDYLFTRFDVRTGQALGQFALPPAPPAVAAPDADEPELYQQWPQQLIWLPDGRLLVLQRQGLGLCALGGSRWLAYHQGFMPPSEFGAMLQNMVWQPAHPEQVIVADANGPLVALQLSTGQVLRRADFAWPELLPGPLGQQLLLYIDKEEAYVLLDPATLAVARRYPFAGLQGVRTEAENQHQKSCTLWEKRALLSPSGKYLLAIDRSGLVWLFDAQSGYQLRIFRRELINHAYDLLWLNDQHFLALTNRGHVVKIDITQQTSVFDVTDFTAEDDARHLPAAHDDVSMRTARSAADVLAALDTLATTPDAATYAQAWDTIHFAPADFDWRTHLTPARLDGAMRHYAWMLPESKFAGLELFARMRQALLAVQYHLPTAPVAPVLALHDSVFGPSVTFETLEAEFEKQEIEYQLTNAYEQLRWALLDAEACDEETGEPFVLSEPFAAYEQLCAETTAFAEHFSRGYGWEAHNVLERAFPPLAGYYAERLATFPAPVQRRLLQPVRWHDDPSAVALLRQLAATSPHQDIRAFATRALAEAGQ